MGVVPRLCRATAVVVIGALATATIARAQTPPQPQTTTPDGTVSQTVAVEDLPVSLERIREALARAPESRLGLRNLPTFSITVEGRPLRLEEFIDLDELSRSPAPATPMTHHEFLDLVTPPEARPYASSVNGDLVQLLATSVGAGLGVSALTSIVSAFREARNNRERERVRREIAELLDELARQKARASQETSGAAPNSPSPDGAPVQKPPPL